MIFFLRCLLVKVHMDYIVIMRERVIGIARLENPDQLPSPSANALSPFRRRDAPRCRPSSSRWCSLLNQRGIQMAADAPGIQIVAINPRKAALELQPNVSRPAITRPSPAKLSMGLATSKANSFLRSRKRSATWTFSFNNKIWVLT